jgi:NADPH2:quinone reductase
MRAWQVQQHGEPSEALRQVETDVPTPGPGQLRLRVTAAGLGLPDVFMCRGIYPLTPKSLPFTPGQEATGVVTAVGDGVSVPIGSRVMVVTSFMTGNGGFADEALADAHSAFPVPPALPDVDAAGFWIPHLTAWVGLVDRGGLVPGDWLAVLGAGGGSGAAAVQLGRALGAHVIAVVGDQEKAALCRSLGAEVTIDHRDGPVGPALLEATGGHGADLVYDPVGGAPAEDAAGGLARGGRLLAIGFASGRWPQIDAHRFVTSNTSLVGVLAGGDRDALDSFHAELSSLVERGALRSVVTDRVPFAQLPEGLERLATRAIVGKAVLLVDT